MRSRLAWVVLVAACGAMPAGKTGKRGRTYRYQAVSIPMRDGVHLQTVILTPKRQHAPLPILLERSPYGVPAEKGLGTHDPGPAERELGEDYIQVFQNLRGRFESEGTFVMLRPPGDIDEGTDAYDTIDWLVKNVPDNNGRVGMTGTSYDAWLATEALRRPHPALKAICEQASPADMFLGDDFHHNGAFRLDYGFEYAALLETDPGKLFEFPFHSGDLYEWFLDVGPLAHVTARLGKERPTWEAFRAHPNRDAYWVERSAETSIRPPTQVPVLHVAGWWDQEDFYGPQEIYRRLEPADDAHLSYFLAGPWFHGGWWGKGRKLGKLDFGADTGEKFATMQARWFRHFLHGDAPLDLAEATVFETGTNRWRTFDHWPPREATPRRLYLRAGRALSFDPPGEIGAFDSYVSDPANPVPYRPRPITPFFSDNEHWREWLVQDQRFVDHRPDVLGWKTGPLAEPVVIGGDVVADLRAATSGADCDWVVKLIDVYPDDDPALPGFQLIIADEVMRARFRDGFAVPRPVPADVVVAYTISLHGSSHAFLKGHRIMVQVQSSWFPLIDRNPQTWVDNIFEAREADFHPATQRVYRAKDAPSAIVLPVLPAAP